MNETQQQVLAWIIGGYLFFVIAYVILHLTVMFAIIGVWLQARRIALALEDNGEYLRRISYGVRDSNHEVIR